MHRRFVPAAVVLALVASIALTTTAVSATPRSNRFHVTGGATETSRFTGAKSVSGRVAKTDKSLLGKKSSKALHVLVKLDYDAVASYAGGRRGLAATSPSVTRKSLKQNRAAVSAYKKFVAGYERKVVSAAKARVGGLQVTQTYRNAYGGVAATLPANKVGALLQVPGVTAVQKDELTQPLDIQEPWQFVGADQTWPGLGGQTLAGSNVIIGDLDTGVWPENPMLQDKGLPAPSGGPYACQFGDGSDPALGAPFTCNNKLIGAYAFTDTYLSVFGSEPGEFCDNKTGECSARDSDGHGTHTLTTAGGDFVDHAPIFGIDRGPTSGLAPGAHLIMYRVCLDQGCFQSDSVAAVNQAITDGVNVINFSISGGGNAYSDPVELAFLDFYASGGLANASAGNAGPGPATADHGGAWTNTVGASYPPRLYLTTLHLRAKNGATFSATGSSITPGISTPTTVVRPSDVSKYTGGDTCSTPFAAGSVSGKVVACARGNPAGRNASAFNVLQGGGVGMILFNTTHQDLFTDNFWVPTVMLDGGTWKGETQPAAALQAFLAGHKGSTATFATGVKTAATPDIMTTFSSRGPLGSWIKPDVTAPGIEILAGNSAQPWSGAIPSGPPGQNFQAIAGTSMSAPHATGVSALVKAAHPTWTAGQVKSALMTSAVQSVLQPDGLTPADPFNMGAGSIRANRAVKPTLTFDVPASTYQALAADPLHRIDANLPSIDAPEFSGSITTERRAVNVSGSSQSFTVSTTAPAGATIDVKPASFNVPAGGNQLVQITINGESLAPNQQYFGSIKLDAASPSATDVYLPVAFFKKQGVVTLSHSCSPTSFPQGSSSGCTVTAQNFSPNAAATDITVTSPNSAGLKIQNVTESHNASSSGHISSGSSGFTWSGTLSPSIAPTVDAITPGGSPAGYLPLSGFGIAPIGDMDDEQLDNFNVPDFTWGSETYSRIGVDSNGYVVVGGGGSDDNDFVPQTFPDPARPNNVIAPWWTDLNPAEPGHPANTGVRIGILSDGADEWLVVDWEDVPAFGEPSNVSDFEVWIGLNGDAHPTEDVTLAYGNLGTGAATGLNSGAENRDGSSGQNIPQPIADGSDFTIHTSPPTPGGKVEIGYNALGIRKGTYTVPARMTTDQTAGTTTEQVTLTVT